MIRPIDPLLGIGIFTAVIVLFAIFAKKPHNTQPPIPTVSISQLHVQTLRTNAELYSVGIYLTWPRGHTFYTNITLSNP